MVYSPTDLSDLLGPDPPAPSNSIPATMTESELAAFLGIGTSQVRTKARDGILIRSGRGRFDVRASLRRYLEQLRYAAGYRGQPTTDELKAEKVRVATAQADSLEMKNAATRGDMVRALDVEREWAGILRDVRSTLLAVPSRVGARLPHLTARDVAELEREIKSALGALSDGN